MKNYTIKQEKIKNTTIFTLYTNGCDIGYIFLTIDEAQKFAKAFNLDVDTTELKQLCSQL